MEIKVVNLKEKFDSFSSYWDPKILGELNAQQVKIARLKGEFVFHQHDNEDELFLVLEGKLEIQLEDRRLEITPGEFVIIPKGTPHQPIAAEEVKVLLFEPASTLNTGNQENELTKREPDRI